MSAMAAAGGRNRRLAVATKQQTTEGGQRLRQPA